MHRPRTPRRRGHIVGFDAPSGLGTLGSDGRMIEFHCLEITDGSRTIDPDQEVVFDVVVRFGRLEAARIEPLSH